MANDVLDRLNGLTGQEVTVRFANAGITGRLVSVGVEPWGYVLHLWSAVGEHFVAFPGEVLHLAVPNRETE